MHILIAGATGFLGRALTARLAEQGHALTILTRQEAARAVPAPIRVLQWHPDGTLGDWAGTCGPVDVVINLSGESIAARRWTGAQKTRLLTSRILPTRSLVAYAHQSSPPPALLVNASAIGFYGDAGEALVDEQAPGGGDFLARLVADWEGEALRASGSDTRVVLVRTGIVLDPAQGALAKMLPPFRLGMGGPFGSGRQYMSWIHRDDWVSLLEWLIESPGTSGAYNATAPTPVTNVDFARTLGRVLARPAFVPTPPLALKLALGEMAGPLLLFSQRVVPARALAGGFAFRFVELEGALRDLTGKTSPR